MTQFDYRMPSEEVRQKALEDDALVRQVRDHTPEEIESWIDANVADAGTARALKVLARVAVAALLRASMRR